MTTPAPPTTALIARLHELIRTGLAPHALLAEAVALIGHTLRYVDVGVLLVDPADPGQLVLRASNYAGFPDAVDNYRQPVTAGLIGRVMQSGVPLVIDDVTTEPGYLPVPGLAIQAEIVMPIFVAGRLAGVLNAESEHPVTPAEVAAMRQAAELLGEALGRAG